MSPTKWCSFYGRTMLLVEIVAIVVASAFLSPIRSQDLSLLTEEQKAAGAGQFQAKPEKPDESDEEKEKKKRRNHPRPHSSTVHHFHHGLSNVDRNIAFGAAGAGAVGAGAALYSDAWGTSNSSESLIVDTPSAPPADEYLLNSPHNELPSVGNSLRFRDRYTFSAAVNGVLYRDMSNYTRLVSPGLSSNKLNWDNGSGLDGRFAMSPKSGSDLGVAWGFLLFDGDSQATIANATQLLTTPAIGFASHPLQSTRETHYWGTELNLLLADPLYQPHIGVRIHQFDEKLVNQVLPNGIRHTVDTQSLSFLGQLGIAPRVEFRFLHLESLLQIGAGVFGGNATTNLAGVVNSPGFGTSNIETEKWAATVFAQARFGAVVPVTKYGKLRGGLQLMTQSHHTNLVAQMESIDFADGDYKLQTRSYFLGGLYCGIELVR